MSGEQEIINCIHIENVDQKMNFFNQIMTLMKLRLDFPFTDLFQHFGIYLLVFALASVLFMGIGVGNGHLCCEIKSHKTTI